MFGIGTGELLVLFVMVLLIYGPQKLPELAAKLGKFSREAKNALDDVRSAMAAPKEEVKKWGQEMMIPPPPPIEKKPDEKSSDAKEESSESGKDIEGGK